MRTPKSSKDRAYPRRIDVRIDQLPHMERLIANIPYCHKCRISKTDRSDKVIFHLRLKTQEILAFKLAGDEVRK